MIRTTKMKVYVYDAARVAARQSASLADILVNVSPPAPAAADGDDDAAANAFFSAKKSGVATMQLLWRDGGEAVHCSRHPFEYWVTLEHLRQLLNAMAYGRYMSHLV